MSYATFAIEASKEPFSATRKRIKLALLPALLAFAAAVSHGQNPAAVPPPTSPTTVPNPTHPGTVPLPTPTPLPFRLDHFLCYLVEPVQFQPKPGLSLIDQFNPKPRPFALAERQWLCNPVSKNGEPIRNPRGHLAGYVMKEATTPPLNIPVVVTNQFGPQRFIVLQQNRLFVPTGKAPFIQTTTAVPPPPPIPQGLDHFACYTVKPESTVPQPGVVLSDQFGRLQGQVVEPLFLCNPAQKLIDNKPTG